MTIPSNDDILALKFLKHISNATNRIVAKGKTALWAAYNYPDKPYTLSFDGYTTSALNLINSFSESLPNTVPIIKENSSSLLSAMVKGNDMYLPIEISYQNRYHYTPEVIDIVNDTWVYNVDELMFQLVVDEICHDNLKMILHLYINYNDVISMSTIQALTAHLNTKPLKQYDNIFNKFDDKAREQFMQMYSDLNLI